MGAAKSISGRNLMLDKPDDANAKKLRNYSRPPLIVGEIEGRPVEIVGEEGKLTILLAGEHLLDLEDWQYHVLNGLVGHGGDTLAGLSELVKDRFNLTLPEDDIAAFFRKLKAFQLTKPEDEARFQVVRRALGGDTPETVEEAKEKAVAPTPQQHQDAPRMKGIRLFRPMRLLRMTRNLFGLGKYAFVIFPPIALVAAFQAYIHWDKLIGSFNYGDSGDFLTAVLLGLVTTNLVATVVYAIAAFGMGATVSSVVLRFIFFFIPRLGIVVEDTSKINRRQAMWMYAAPLIARLYLGCATLLLYASIQHTQSPWLDTLLTISVISVLSFLVTACPFYRSHGYFILVEFLDEPRLMSKSYKALFHVLNRNYYQNVDGQVMVAFAMVSFTFIILLAALAFIIFGRRLIATIGVDALIIVAILVMAFIWRVVGQLRKTNETYWKNYRFERWRDRTLPSQEQRKIADKQRITQWGAIKLMLLALFVIAMFQNYTYRPSGAVNVLPQSLNELSSDIEGIVAEVYHQGGEILAAGTPVARLSTEELEAEIKILEGRKVKAESDLAFAKLDCELNQELFDRATISELTLNNALANCAAAEAQLGILDAEMNRLVDRIERSTFRMPYDGQLGTLYLKQRLGTFLREGEPIATVRDTSSFQVRISVRETDLGIINEGEPIEMRIYADHNRVFYGTITSIDPDIEPSQNGARITMVGTIEDADGILRSGMTGFAKTAGVQMPVWQIITQGISRFFIIDLWAWLP